MITKYKINNSEHSITFCKKNNLNLISNAILKSQSDRNILFVYDRNVDKSLVNEIVGELKITGCNIHLLECSGNKKNKSEKLLFKILDMLIKFKFTKRSVVLSFGGGVLGDVAALASCLYLRGTYYFCIPTTMTSIVDSSLGGKTAINYRGLINAIGSYYHPTNVFIIENVIKKIPKREFLAGIPEIIKCGVIDNYKIINYLKNNSKAILSRRINNVFELCNLTLLSKIKHFKDDIYEKNQRLYLNFGHTFAHAVEMATEKIFKDEKLRHGEAVGIGMLSEIFYANRKKSKIYNVVFNLLRDFGLPTSLDKSLIKKNYTKLQNEIYHFIFLDKKKISKNPRYISLKKLSKPSVQEIKDFDFLNDTISKIILNR